jgi:predicted glycoside hydrolase/deacetylase ChbG (UPF0249 family)
MKRIWLVADDYGITPPVNGAIRDLIARERLSATSVMVVAPGFNAEEARYLRDTAREGRAAIGLHLTLTAPFAPLTRGYAPLARGTFLPLGKTMALGFLGQLDREKLKAEIRAQIDAFAAAFGRPPDYIDGHQHVHLLPHVTDALLEAVKEAAPRAWLRQCQRAPGAPGDRKAWVLDFLSRRFRRRAAAAGIRTNSAFAGTYDFAPDANFAALFPAFLEGLPDGGLVMCHPGVVDEALRALDPVTTLREREYAYFKGEAFPAALTASGAILMRPDAAGA